MLFTAKNQTCILNLYIMKYKVFFSGLMVMAVIMVVAFKPVGKKIAPIPAVNNTGEKGIQFVEPNWAKALAEAKKQKKLIFIDAYTTWCGPCRLLKQNTFTDKAVGDFFNKNFINIALDMEKGDGLAFAAKYQIVAYPTLLIIDADQTSTSVSEGYMPPAQLLDFAKSVLAQKRK